MIGIVDVEIQAQNPEAPLYPMKAYKGSPSSVRVRNAPKRIGDWHLTKVYFSATYPDGETKTAQCVLTGGVWVGTIAASTMSGTCKNGYTIFADGKDENDNPVVGYVLGKGDVTIMENDGTIEPDRQQYTVHLLSAESDKPLEGDLYPKDGGYVIWQDGEEHPLGASGEFLPLSGGSMEGPIQMGALDSQRIFFENHSIAYASPNSIGFFTDNDTHGAYLDLGRTSPLSGGTIDTIAYVRDIEDSLSAVPTLNGTNGKTVVTTYNSTKREFDWRGEVSPQTIQDAGLTLDAAGATGIAYVQFGTEVSSIADETFKNSQVQIVSFSGNIQNIGISAFAGSSRLMMVNCYEDSVASTIAQKTLTIKKHAFASCATLHHVELPLCFYSIASDAHVFEGTPWNQSQVISFPNAQKGVYLKWFRNGETYARTNLSASLSCDPSLIHAWNPASMEWAEGSFAKSFAFVTATTALGPSLLQLKGCLDGTNSYVSVTGARNVKIWAGGTTNQSDVIAASDHMREMYIKITVDSAYTKTLSWATYYDKWVGGTKEELSPKAGETAYFHVWEYESQHFAVEKIGAVEQKLSAYLPLSGDATAAVVTNSLSANAIINGQPNTSGTIGPDEEGNHYNGVYIDGGSIDIQSSRATQTVDWYGTKIEGTGKITLKEKNAEDPVITYDELKLPKTQSNSTRTLATQEWVLEQLSALQARVAALEGN